MDIHVKNKISDLRVALQAADSRLQHVVVAVDGIRFDSGRLIADKCEFEIGDRGFAALCDAIGAPGAYLRKLHTKWSNSLIAYQVSRGDHLARLAPSRRRGPVALVAINGVFIGFKRADLSTLRGVDVLDAALAGIEDGSSNSNVIVNHYDISAVDFAIELRTPTRSREVLPGDVINGGISLRHSLIGESATIVESFLFRLVCSNGAVVRECASTAKAKSSRIRRRSGSGDAYNAAVRHIREYTSTLVTALSDKLLATEKLLQQRVSNPRQFVERQLRNVPRLYSVKLVDRIMAAFELEPGDTAYHAFNAMTWVASHQNDMPADHRLSPAMRRNLALLTGVLARSSNHLCPSCFRILS